MIDQQSRRQLFSDSLTERRRLARRPLPIWIAELRGQLAALPPDDAAADGLATVQNNLALMLLHARGAAAAADSCVAQIEWAVRIGRGDLLLQPLVNLIRLDRHAGRRVPAEDKLAVLEAAARTGLVAWRGQHHPLSREAREFCATLALNETILLLMALDPRALPALYREPRFAEAAANAALFAESPVQAALIVGDEDAFGVWLDAFPGRSEPFNALVDRFYRAAGAWLFGEDARPLVRLAAQFTRIAEAVLASDAAIDHRFLRLAFAIARCAGSTGETMAATLQEQCLAVAARIQDVPILVQCRLAVGEPAGRVAADAARTGYARLRDVPPAEISPAERQSIDRLLDSFAADLAAELTGHAPAAQAMVASA